MSSVVKVRNVMFGEGIPKICIPLTDESPEELKESVEKLLRAPFDFVEWRADFYKDLTKTEMLVSALELLRSCLCEVPVLFTVRTSDEGGHLVISTKEYIDIYLSAFKTGLIDLADVELSRGEDVLSLLTEAAHEAGVRIVASCHDSVSTPSKETIVERLCRMQELGADLAKYAVTPQSDRDVLTLMDATLTMQEDHGKTPVITMSMGRLGAISRVSGSVFGSSVTFGTAGRASAPGQLPAELLDAFLHNMI